jgi:hypothetical protein
MTSFTPGETNLKTGPAFGALSYFSEIFSANVPFMTVISQKILL